MKANRQPQVKPMVRKGWVVRITDRMGNVHFPIFKDMHHVEIDRQDDYYNDLVPHLTIFATKEIAQSRVSSVREAAVEAANSTFLTKPVLPVKVEVVRYLRQIG